MFIEKIMKAMNFLEYKESSSSLMNEKNVFIMELKFLDIFLRVRCCTEDGNLLDVSQRVIDNVFSNPFFHGSCSGSISELQEKISICKSEIRNHYSYPQPQCQVVNIFHDDTPKILAQLISDVRSTLHQYLHFTSLIRTLIEDILFGLTSWKSFFDLFVSRKGNFLPTDHVTTFFTHAIAVTDEAAMIVFLHFPDSNNVNRESALQETDVHPLLIDLLFNRILPIQPCIQRMYVDFLQYSYKPDSLLPWSQSHLADVSSLFTFCIDPDFWFSRLSMIVCMEDQDMTRTLFEMFKFLRVYFLELPSQSFGSQHRDVSYLMLNVTLVILMLYEKYAKTASGEIYREVSLDLNGFIQSISHMTHNNIRFPFKLILPRIDGLGFVDFLLDKMKAFLSYSVDSLPATEKEQLKAVLKELEFLRPVLMDVAAEQCIEHNRYQHLVKQVIGKAYEIEYIFDCYMSKDVPNWCLTPWLSELIKEIEFVKAEIKNIKGNNASHSSTVNASNASSVASSSQLANMRSITGEMVGFEDVLESLRHQIVSGTTRALDVISVVGAPGLGKTTVANKIFNDELVVSLFDVRATCFVPVVYECRELLVAILKDVVNETIDLSEVPQHELSNKLHKFLLSKRYLVLVDNVNDPAAWDCLRSCFPDENNGSKILLTTRVGEVAVKARCISPPYYLRILFDEESWMLLQNMAFPRRGCPPGFRTFGKELAKRCGGSPFQVVVMAGALAKMTMKELELLAEGDTGANRVFSKAKEVMFDQVHDSQPGSHALQDSISSQLACAMAEDLVGFEDVIQTLLNELVGGTPERDVISIVGMAGQGKTTIATTLFINELVVMRFDVLAKCYVSQAYERRELLVSILGDVVDTPTDLSEVPEDGLADMLRKLLLRKRYLILIDDAWESRTWDDLQSCFPDDKNGSRIILTTRLDEVANYASTSPHHLRLFSDDESWALFRKKVFPQQSCPPELEGVGREIVRKCAGLPLSIVLVAGVLASMMKKEQWEQVADDLGSHILGDSKHIVQFSYKNLPYYLKPCFLYFGAFLEDKEIRISKLMKLWAAEGLVAKQKDRCLVDIAEDQLEELIKRNMVMAAKKKSLGKVKACRVHDLLLEFCKEKAKEEKFLLWIYSDLDADRNIMLAQMLRMSIYSKQHHLGKMSPSCSNVHSILFRLVGDDVVSSLNNHVSFAFHSFKCLRVLDMEFVTVDSFPTELSHLRYLALRTAEKSVPSSISNLQNLETLMVKGLGSELSLPHSLCKMVKMRHLHINDRASFDLHNLKEFLEDPSQLENLEILSTPVFSSGEDAERVLKKTPNLRKLRCIFSGLWGFSEVQERECNQFPKLQHLTKLESLKVLCFHYPVRSPCEFNFPSGLKKLTLSGFRLPWTEISAISGLHNLAVLKLKCDAFCGEEWEVRDEQFSQLKVLKLESVSLVRWSTSEDAFSKLEQLVLHNCDCLVEIPSEFSYFCCLQSIEVKSCQESVANSAKEVAEIQVEEMQNNGFKLSISK